MGVTIEFGHGDSQPIRLKQQQVAALPLLQLVHASEFIESNSDAKSLSSQSQVTIINAQERFGNNGAQAETLFGKCHFPNRVSACAQQSL